MDVTRQRYETEEQTGQHSVRREALEPLNGELKPDEVARHLELAYARLYQPHWDEATSKIDEKAQRWPDGAIVVGHEPQLVARLVDDAKLNGAGEARPATPGSPLPL